MKGVFENVIAVMVQSVFYNLSYVFKHTKANKKAKQIYTKKI
jgi:phospholipase C